MITKSTWFPAICVAVILSLVFGLVLFYRADSPVVQGVTNFDSITLSEDLVVGGTSTLTGAVSLLAGCNQTTPLSVTGTTNDIQLNVTGFTTQTQPLQLWETYAGVNKATIDNSGNMVLTGTLGVAGATSLATTLAVTGYSNLNGGVYDSSGDLNLRDNTVVTGTLAVTGISTLTGALAANGGLSVDSPAFTVANGTGAIATGSTLSVGSDATLQESLIISQTTITLVNGNNNLTVDVSMYTIDASTAASITLTTTGAVPGQVVFFYGQDAQTITFNNTNVKTSSGAAVTIGQFDVIAWLFDGTYWIELLLIANS